MTNSFGQTHEIPNLYVAGPGIFPTAGASNPTYTIFALSQRGAENLGEDLEHGRGVGGSSPQSFRGAASAANPESSGLEACTAPWIRVRAK